ncbi:MAG: DNA mismatch endonuclease Vsr [Bryobacterales bacterium]|nr:DNA mismatch endonuclease Vsr [Bryobacterales bacterium]
MDTLTPAERSARMSLVRSKDTKPEMLVRRLVHGMGFRYRLHGRSLPGKPDLVFAGRRSVVFVHGCFWHRHGICKNTRWPKSKLDFWRPKLERNHERDVATRKALRKLGWRVLIVWECQLENLPRLSRRIRNFLEAVH